MAALIAAPALAESVSFSQVPATVAYKVASNNWSVTVRHPFRVIQISGRNALGSLSFTPGDFRKGVQYSLEFPIGKVPWPDADLRQDALGLLGNSITVSGNTIDILKWSEREEGIALLETHPEVRIKARSIFPPVRIKSAQDGRVLQWAFSSEFPLTDIGIQVPRLWGIPGEDKVVVAGEISFSPKD